MQVAEPVALPQLHLVVQRHPCRDAEADSHGLARRADHRVFPVAIQDKEFDVPVVPDVRDPQVQVEDYSRDPTVALR